MTQIAKQIIDIAPNMRYNFNTKGGNIMATTNLSIRIDKDLKAQAEKFFSEIGMSMSTAVNVFFRQSLRQGKIPFEISIESHPYFDESNMNILKQSIHQLDEGKIVEKTLEELRAME
jgi:DNA-damage-inducible protein J